jgi:Bacterial membrane protein YfhO
MTDSPSGLTSADSPLRSTSARRAAVAAVLVALVLTTLSSSLVGGKILSSGDVIFVFPPFSAQRPPGWVRPTNPLLSDVPFAYHPLLLQTRRDLANGILPLWNPYEGSGVPLLAWPQGAPLFPLTWLAFLLPFWSSFAWIAAAKLLLTWTGTYLFCRDLRLRRGPALLGATAFAFGFYYIAWLEHIDVTNVWAMLPWMFLATRWVCTRGSLVAAALLGGSCGLAWLGGHPESQAIVFGATAVYGALELVAEVVRGPSTVSRSEPLRGPAWTTTILGRALLLIVALALGVGVSAVVTVPFLQFMQQSPKTLKGGAPAPLQQVWSSFFPELWGNPSKAYSSAAGPLNFNERTAYIGALPLLLGVGSIGRHRPREQWFFVGLAVVCLATIYDTPLWANAVRSLPVGAVVNLNRLLIVLSLSGAVLAAYGLQRWLTGTSRDRRHMLLIMGIVAVIPPLAWVPRHLSVLSSLPSALGQLPAVHSAETSGAVVALGSVWRWILICAIGIAGLALARRMRSPVLAIALVVVVTSVDLVTVEHGYHGLIPLSQANPPVPEAVRYLQAHEGDARVTASGGVFWAKLPEQYGLRDPRVGDQAFRSKRYQRLWTSLGGTFLADYTFFAAETPGGQRLADLFAVRYVLLAPGEAAPPWLKPVLRTAGGTVAWNRTALPRAWVAYDWRQARTEPLDLVLTTRSTTGQLLSQPIIENSPAPPSGRTPPPIPAQVTADGPESVTISATARRPGYLILDDQAYPGWQASIDGRTVHWTAANENFRAVPIPVGRHVVRFAYRPTLVLVGAIISAVCLVALLALAAFGFVWGRRSRKSPANESSTADGADARRSAEPAMKPA